MQFTILYKIPISNTLHTLNMRNNDTVKIKLKLLNYICAEGSKKDVIKYDQVPEKLEV